MWVAVHVRGRSSVAAAAADAHTEDQSPEQPAVMARPPDPRGSVSTPRSRGRRSITRDGPDRALPPAELLPRHVAAGDQAVLEACNRVVEATSRSKPPRSSGSSSGTGSRRCRRRSRPGRGRPGDSAAVSPSGQERLTRRPQPVQMALTRSPTVPARGPLPEARPRTMAPGSAVGTAAATAPSSVAAAARPRPLA